MLRLTFTSSIPDLSAFTNDDNFTPAIDLIKKWYGGHTSFTFQSSGSTGTAKEITLSKEFLEASAQRTIRLFNIQSSDTLLLALNTSFMGGMMMVVRAIVAQCELVYLSPQSLSTDTLRALPRITLASFVPAQVSELLSSSTQDPFITLDHVLLGGAPVSQSLHDKLVALKSACRFYHTYGMTETASHVAIKELSQTPSDYKALEGFDFSVDERQCLVIHHRQSPVLELVTNDMVNLHSPLSFDWIGRVDWVINSGGVKYNLEKAEESVAVFFQNNRLHYNFTSYKSPDETWGEKWVLLVEGVLSAQQVEALKAHCKKHLGKYVFPKDILYTNKTVYLPSGKVDRLSTYKEATKPLS